MVASAYAAVRGTCRTLAAAVCPAACLPACCAQGRGAGWDTIGEHRRFAGLSACSPRYAHGMRQFWYGINGQPISLHEANELLASSANRTVACTMIATDKGQITVSTVHLVLDHRFGSGPPILWETLVFEGPTDSDMTRYHSLDEAIAGHAAAVTLCRTALDLDGAEVVAIEHVNGPANLRHVEAAKSAAVES